MLSKNHWVRPFSLFFRFVREILFVTVALDHPVAHHYVVITPLTFDHQYSGRFARNQALMGEKVKAIK